MLRHGGFDQSGRNSVKRRFNAHELSRLINRDLSQLGERFFNLALLARSGSCLPFQCFKAQARDEHTDYE